MNYELADATSLRAKRSNPEKLKTKSWLALENN
jgi:hypothetical protein